MSDGNFNRQLLPKNELSAGLRAGKAQMRSRALSALKQILEQRFANLSQSERESIINEFSAMLR